MSTSTYDVITVADLNNSMAGLDITSIGKDSDGNAKFSTTEILAQISKAERKVLGHVRQYGIEVTDTFETDEPDIYDAILDLAEIFMKNVLAETGFLQNWEPVDVNAYFKEFVKDNLLPERREGAIKSGLSLANSRFDY